MTNVEDRVEQALHVLADRIEPDVTGARARLRSGPALAPARGAGRPRRWVTLAAAVVVVVGIGSLWAVSTRPQRTVPQTGPLARPDLPATSVAEPVTSVAAVDAGEPAIPTPTRVAVLDPSRGVDPIRSDPVLDWVHATRAEAPRRWFVRRSTDGTPTGGVSIDHRATTEWDTFRDAPTAGIAGVDARVVVTPVGTEVGWRSEDGVRVVAGVGDVDVDETIAVAGLAVTADQLAAVAVPHGFEEAAIPVEEGGVRYQDTMVTIGYSTVPRGGVADAAVAALMAPGRDGPISPLPDEDAWMTTTYEGHPTAVVAVGADGLATIVGLPGTDVASLVPNVAVVPAQEVTVANPEATHGIPANAKKTFGEIDRGRWVVYQYSTVDGYDCISIDASWGGSGDCSPPGKANCPVADLIRGPNVRSMVEVFVPYRADDLVVSLGGEAATVTIEHSQGFTFAYGPAPSPDPTIEVTVGGRPAC